MVWALKIQDKDNSTRDRERAEMSSLLLLAEAYCNSFCCDKSHGQI
jgi:hypothetical protein